MQPAQFSADWYAIFLDRIPPEQTAAETAFIARQLPLSSYPTLLDVCSGPGRHVHELAQMGYRVLGVDTNAAAVARARAHAPPGSGASFQQLDMRNLDVLAEQFDGVVNLWASFGYFDDATNEAILHQIRARLRAGGRAVFDLYNRDHMVGLPAVESAQCGGITVRTERRWLGTRLTVRLQYASGTGDEFEWRIYTPAEFSALCTSVGLHLLLSCAWFSESTPASAEHARMQFVVERRDSH